MLLKQMIQKALKLNKSSFTTPDLIHNRSILYLFVFMTIVDLFYFVTINDMVSIAIFILIGLLVSFFNKNMIIILFISITLTHVLKYGTKIAISEGMDDANKRDEKDNEDDNNSDDSKSKSMNKGELEKVQGELKDFLKTQDEILEGMKELEPLLSKAENFIEKWEDKYSKKVNV